MPSVTPTPKPVHAGRVWWQCAGLTGLGRWARLWLLRVSLAVLLMPVAPVAAGAVGFAVGHASAQQVWRGLRSKPTWRVLVYSAENPPRQRSLVLVDAVDGTVVEHLTEDNPEEDWQDD